MGRLIMEMLGQDHVKILSIKEVHSGKLNIRIEDSAENFSDITVNFKNFINLLNALIMNRK